MPTKYIENIVIGNLLCSEADLFAENEEDWVVVEKDKTFYTEERYLPKILVSLGIFPSISEIRRNKPELMITLTDVDFLSKVKVKKKRFLWIAVGN